MPKNVGGICRGSEISTAMDVDGWSLAEPQTRITIKIPSKRKNVDEEAMGAEC